MPGTITPRAATTQVLRPPVGVPVMAMAECLPTETVVGGGVRMETTDPRDLSRFHMLEGGPTATGWVGQGAAIQGFAQGSSLILTTTVYCLAP